jgi:ribosomal protein S18 acetylase RimI-like enzyme
MIKIEKAKVEDALGIAIVNVYTWKTQYNKIIDENVIDSRIKNVENSCNKIKERIAEDGNYLVAKIDNTVVGFCRYSCSEKEEYKGYGEINAIYVLEGFQGRKIGKKLFEEAKNELKKIGYNKFVIVCLKENPSIKFYKHMGGKIVKEFENDIHGCRVDECILLFE